MSIDFSIGPTTFRMYGSSLIIYHPNSTPVFIDLLLVKSLYAKNGFLLFEPTFEVPFDFRRSGLYQSEARALYSEARAFYRAFMDFKTSQIGGKIADSKEFFSSMYGSIEIRGSYLSINQRNIANMADMDIITRIIPIQYVTVVAQSIAPQNNTPPTLQVFVNNGHSPSSDRHPIFVQSIDPEAITEFYLAIADAKSNIP